MQQNAAVPAPTPRISKPAAADAKRKQRFGAQTSYLEDPWGRVVNASSRESWEDVPCVFVPAPTCPSCGSTEYERSKTTGSLSTGGKVKRVRCRECDERYKIVIELPETGIEENELPKMPEVYYWNRREE
jgi:hypothetical protein